MSSWNSPSNWGLHGTWDRILVTGLYVRVYPCQETYAFLIVIERPISTYLKILLTMRFTLHFIDLQTSIVWIHVHFKLEYLLYLNRHAHSYAFPISFYPSHSNCTITPKYNSSYYAANAIAFPSFMSKVGLLLDTRLPSCLRTRTFHRAVSK